jgi:hypothetical protein
MSNLDVFQLEQKHFRRIEQIAQAAGQKRYGDWDELWDTDLFAYETLDLDRET